MQYIELCQCFGWKEEGDDVERGSRDEKKTWNGQIKETVAMSLGRRFFSGHRPQSPLVVPGTWT